MKRVLNLFPILAVLGLLSSPLPFGRGVCGHTRQDLRLAHRGD